MERFVIRISCVLSLVESGSNIC